VKQAQAYCEGRWTEWDGAITTPPGLFVQRASLLLLAVLSADHQSTALSRYLIPAGLAHLRKLIPEGSGGGIDPCSVSSLRGFNLLILAVLPLLYTSLLSSIHSESTTVGTSSSAGSKPSKLAVKSKLSESETLRNSLKREGLVIALMPTVSFFGYFYYTDLLSLLSLLLSYRFSLSRRYFFSSLVRSSNESIGSQRLMASSRGSQLGGTSLICRQTNIIWIGFVLATSIIREINLLERARLGGIGNGAKKGGNQLYDPLLGQSRLRKRPQFPHSLGLSNKRADSLLCTSLCSRPHSHALLDRLPYPHSSPNNLHRCPRLLSSPLRWFRFLPLSERRITRLRYVGSIPHYLDDYETDVAASTTYRR